MIYACNGYKNDQLGDQNSDPWENFIFHLKHFGGKFKIVNIRLIYSVKPCLNMMGLLQIRPNPACGSKAGLK